VYLRLERSPSLRPAAEMSFRNAVAVPESYRIDEFGNALRTVSKSVQIWSLSRTYEFMTLSRVGELMCVFARRFIIRLSQLSVVEKNNQHDR